MAVKLQALAPVTLTLSNTAYQLSSTPMAVTSVTLQASYSNAAKVCFGDSAVTASSGLEIPPGDTAEITADVKGQEFYLDEVYLISSSAGQVVRAVAFVRKP